MSLCDDGKILLWRFLFSWFRCRDGRRWCVWFGPGHWGGEAGSGWHRHASSLAPPPAVTRTMWPGWLCLHPSVVISHVSARGSGTTPSAGHNTFILQSIIIVFKYRWDWYIFKCRQMGRKLEKVSTLIRTKYKSYLQEFYFKYLFMISSRESLLSCRWSPWNYVSSFKEILQ